MSKNAAASATSTPTMSVLIHGVWYFGCTRASVRGSRPSRDME
jgi:hypothetical protein